MNTSEINVEIIIHRLSSTENLIEHFDYEWKGPKDGIIGISGALMQEGDPSVFSKPKEYPEIDDVIYIGPYAFRIIEHQQRPVEIYFAKAL